MRAATTEPASLKVLASVMKRRSTEAEQQLHKERDALRQSFDEQAEELSDALARAELAAEQRLGECPADDETEQLKRRLKGHEAGVTKLTEHCQSLTNALIAVEARGARRYERGKCAKPNSQLASRPPRTRRSKHSGNGTRSDYGAGRSERNYCDAPIRARGDRATASQERGSEGGAAAHAVARRPSGGAVQVAAG